MKHTLLAIIVILTAATSMQLLSCKPKSEIPELLENQKNIGDKEENATIKNAYDKAVKAIKDNPEDLQQYLNLASVFISEGRITGDYNYYSNAAMKMLNKVTDANSANRDLTFQALSLKSAVQLNMHQFKDALATAQQGVQINSFNSGIFGALVDANVEMGNYDEAVKDCDKMMSIRPDLRSYSRASYLRQIFGQNGPAIDAMKMAVDAGLPGSENTEWTRVHLGDLYLNVGNLDSASIIYRTCLVYRPDYPAALMGMSRAAQAKKDYKGAIAYNKQAIRILSEAAFVANLADLYELSGDSDNARQTRADVISMTLKGQEDEPRDALVKHNLNRELAMAYADAGELDKALSYAQNDLNMRPSNIDANELIAWIYYLKGDYANASTHADKMLATHTKNMNTLYRAGLIYISAGNAALGTQLMQLALATSPYVDQRIINHGKAPVSVNRT